MADIEDLYSLYSSFCSFGSSRNLSTPLSSQEALGGPQMDGAKFAKFARDTKILDKTISSVDIDIFFNKAKKKDARKLDFDSFQAALKLVAEKKYPTLKAGHAYDTLLKTVVSKKGPKSSGTTPKVDDIVSRLTDTSKYTGTHKHRFDETGKGRGILGRDRPNPTADLSQITNREAATITGVPLSAALQGGVVYSSTGSLRTPSGTKRSHDLVKSKDSLYTSKK